MESYRNRKVHSISWYALRNMLVPIIGKQKGPFANNQPQSDDATDSTADNCKRRAKQLRHHTGLHLPQLWAPLKENLVHACHSSTNMVGRLQLADRVADNRTDRIRGSRDGKSEP